MEQTFTIPYKTLDRSELSEQDRQLEERALEVAQKAYAPYSRFHVGAAVLLANGEIVTGSNQENAAYPSGTCAERTALFWAGAPVARRRCRAPRYRRYQQRWPCTRHLALRQLPSGDHGDRHTLPPPSPYF